MRDGLNLVLKDSRAWINYMMLGGGFLRQMNETLKYNRELLGKVKRKPFEKPLYTEGDGSIKLIDSKVMGDQERSEFIRQIKLKERKERYRQVKVLFISALATVVLVYLFISIFEDLLK